MNYEGLLSWQNPVTTGLLYSLLSLVFACGAVLDRFTLTGVALNAGVLAVMGVVTGIHLRLIRKDWIEQIDWQGRGEQAQEIVYTGVNGVIRGLYARATLSRAPYFALFLVLAADLALCIRTSGLLFLYTQYLFAFSAVRTFLGLNPEAIVNYCLEVGKERANHYLNLLPKAKSAQKSD